MLIEWLRCVRIAGRRHCSVWCKDKGRLYLSSLRIISKDNGKVSWRETRTSLGYNSNYNQAQGIGASTPLGYFSPPITPRRQIYRSCQKNNMYQVSTIIDSLARKVVVLVLSVVADVVRLQREWGKRLLCRMRI